MWSLFINCLNSVLMSIIMIYLLYLIDDIEITSNLMFCFITIFLWGSSFGLNAGAYFVRKISNYNKD